jgi:hypothetical protein
VSEISPIGPAESHVKVEDGGTETVQVLVEYSFEFCSHESVALVKARSAPWIKAASLEFQDAIWCGRALLQMQVFPVRGQLTSRPYVRVAAIEAEGVSSLGQSLLRASNK